MSDRSLRDLLEELSRSAIADAPSDCREGEYRLIAAGYRNKTEAEYAAIEIWAPLLRKKVQTNRFLIRAMPISSSVPGGRRTSGWGVYLRDRAHQAGHPKETP